LVQLAAVALPAVLELDVLEELELEAEPVE